MNNHWIITCVALVVLLSAATGCRRLSGPPTLSELILNARQGNTGAQYHYACMALTGKGMDQNPELALKWFRVAAAARHPAATGAMGICYLAGLGTEKDEALGMRYLIQGARLGHIPSALTLANLAKSRGNQAEFFKWLFHAAEAGDLATQDLIAELYLSGMPFPLSDREMLNYLRYAAINNNPRALYAMYLCNLHGKGTPRNPLLADAWLRMAAKEGSDEAKAILRNRPKKSSASTPHP